MNQSELYGKTYSYAKRGKTSANESRLVQFYFNRMNKWSEIFGPIA